MLELKDLKIYILDSNKMVYLMLKRRFDAHPEVAIVNDDFQNFMKNNNVEAVVSPANSYGIMDGGYDKAITDYFGWDLAVKVQNVILRDYMGEQPVGTAITMDTNRFNKKLIHIPTMRIPEKIADPKIVYHCTRMALIECLKNDIRSVVLPAFGGGYGGVEWDDIARYMLMAYEQLLSPPKYISTEYALRYEND